MADPIIGQNVVIQIYKDDSYQNYHCESDCSIDFSKDTKSVKTVGDGNWRRFKTSTNGFEISLNGVIKFDDDGVPHAFDLLDHFRNDTDVLFRLIYTEPETPVLRVIEGQALPTNVTLSSSAEGFAAGNFTLVGSGEPDIRDAVELCSATITDADVTFSPGTPDTYTVTVNTLTGGPVTRYEYTIDGSGRLTAFTDGTLPDSFNLTGYGGPGTKILVIYPICENGLDGVSYGTSFEVFPP